MKTLAIIPARGGSKGVPRKNACLLGGYPLIAYSIAVAAMSEQIERVLVSTDSEEIAAIARYYGAEVPFLRPSQHSQDNSTDRGFLLHAMHWFIDNNENLPEYWVHLRPTTPFRDPVIVGQAIMQIMNHSDSTSLRSGHVAPESPFKWFLRDDNGYFKGIRNDEPAAEYYNLPRQAFPDVYIPDGYVDILKASFVLNSESLHGERMLGFVSPVCHELDTGNDLALLEFQLQKEGSLILDYLKSKFSL
jgi:CMP-N,N'-diacetyllegionaminic acid synthase